LLLRLRDARDHESWTTFVDTYAPLVYRTCRRRGLQDADAADVTQEVLDQVARAMRTFEYRRERGRFRDWLGAVTRHRIGRFFRTRSRGASAAGGDEADPLAQVEAPPDPAWTAEFNHRVLQVALDRVKPHFEAATWRAFERAWLDDRPAAEVAREVGIPVERVYLAKSRVLKQLREEVLVLAENLPPLASLD
jgi:RNA polymerase sigma-70 factor (ECF subfamily)